MKADSLSVGKTEIEMEEKMTNRGGMGSITRAIGEENYPGYLDKGIYSD